MESLNFQESAVRKVSERGLVALLDRLQEAFPAARVHRSALHELGSEVVYAKNAESISPDLAGYWIALVRFGGVIESLFGLNREVLLVYSPFDDLQGRTFEALPRLIKGVEGRTVTPHLAMLTAPDPRLDEKLDEWSSSELQVVPLPMELSGCDRPANEILERFKKRIFARDLYAETTPVTGGSFFGRELLLQSLTEDARSGRSFGLFGLRKVGKTSVLKTWASRLRSLDGDNYVTVICDLESLPSLPEPVAPGLVRMLSKRIRDELKERGFRTREVAELPATASADEFKEALENLLRKLAREDVQIVLGLDEIEYLCPPGLIEGDLAEGQEVTRVLSILRSISQQESNFMFGVAGLASAVLESGYLFGRPNPLFSWARPYHLSFLEPAESTSLIVELGRRMGVDWDQEAVLAVCLASGGHPYLLRDLASRTVEGLAMTVGPGRTVTAGRTEKSIRRWSRTLDPHRQEILDHVDRYYPNERIVVDLLLSEDEEDRELAYGETIAINHLEQLGLVVDETEGPRVIELLRAD
jgi:hypothetical protein